MNKSQRYRAAILDQAFFGQPLAWTDTATAAAFELALYTGDPEAGGSEVAYPHYARPVLSRDAATWSRTGNLVTNRVEARFPLCVAGPRHDATHWAMFPQGETEPCYRGRFDQPLGIEPRIRPVVDPGMIQIEER